MIFDEETISFLDREFSLGKDFTKVNEIFSLRKKYNATISNFIISQAKLRKKAANKLPDILSQTLLFDGDALEQASNWSISKYRCNKLSELLKNQKKRREILYLVDVGSGIGIDTLAYSEEMQVISIEKDGTRFEYLNYNIEKFSKLSNKEIKIELFNEEATINKLEKINFERKNLVIYLDPARRDDSNRFNSIYDYQPSLEIVNEILKITPYLIVKISPAVDLQELQNHTINSPYEIEFVSENSELKECILWFGFTKENIITGTKLPENVSYTKNLDVQLEISICNKFEYLYEPDFAFIRSGTMDLIAKKTRLSKIDEQIAYLAGGKVSNVTWCRNNTYFKRIKVIESIRFEAIFKELIELQITYVDLKKRGFEIDLDNLQVKFNKALSRNQKKQTIQIHKKAVLIFTYISNKKVCIITEKVI